MRIDVASHHFVVTGCDKDPKLKDFMMKYIMKLIQYERRKHPDGEVSEIPVKVFADTDTGRTLHRLHIEMLNRFLKRCEEAGITPDIHYREHYIPAKGVFKLNKHFQPRDYQLPLIDYLCEDGYKKVITLQTGRGKTATLLFAVAQMNVRTAIVIPPKYFDRWVGDMVANKGNTGMFSLRPGKDIMTIQGSSELRTLINLAKDNELTASMLIISAPTIFNWIENFKDDGRTPEYGNIQPDELWELLGVGIVAVDEGHQNFHANFRLDLHTHVPKTIALSATLMPDQAFLKYMFEVMYPTRLRMDGGDYIRYADMCYVPYAFAVGKPRLATSWRGRTDYSQLAFEQSLLGKRSTDRYKAMFDMIKYDIDDLFIRNRAPDHKLLIFFDTVAMCVKFTKDLAPHYPNLKVGKYTSEETYDTLEKLDIIVATTKSADTGVDISKLQMCFCFVARGSSIANLQMFGRLRQLKIDTHKPLFLYYYCTQINAHCNYHESRQELFRDKVVAMWERPTYKLI